MKIDKATPFSKITGLLACLGIVCLGILSQAHDLDKEQLSNGTVTYCFDGDTLKLADRRVVRLAGIDTPEMGRKDKKAQFYARQAKKELEQLVRGKKVRLTSNSERDRYGRIVAEVILEDGRSVNQLMIKHGAAFLYPHADLDPQFMEKLRKLQSEAIKDRRGLWKTILSLPIAKKHYIGNRASMRFFPENCPEAHRIKPRNKIHFGNLMDAFFSGYAPARICPIWPNDPPASGHYSSNLEHMDLASNSEFYLFLAVANLSRTD